MLRSSHANYCAHKEINLSFQVFRKNVPERFISNVSFFLSFFFYIRRLSCTENYVSIPFNWNWNLEIFLNNSEYRTVCSIKRPFSQQQSSYFRFSINITISIHLSD